MSAKKQNKKPKYSKWYHLSMDEAVRSKLDELEKQMEKILEDATKAFPFKEDERVAVMDTYSRKFKHFAYIKELEINMRSTSYYVKYQRESKTGKRERTIITLQGTEFLIPADEADPNDKYEPFKLDFSTIKENEYKF